MKSPIGFLSPTYGTFGWVLSAADAMDPCHIRRHLLPDRVTRSLQSDRTKTTSRRATRATRATRAKSTPYLHAQCTYIPVRKTAAIKFKDPSNLVWNRSYSLMISTKELI